MRCRVKWSWHTNGQSTADTAAAVRGTARILIHVHNIINISIIIIISLIVVFSVIFNFTYRRHKDQHHRWHFHSFTRSLLPSSVVTTGQTVLGVCSSSLPINPLTSVVWSCCTADTADWVVGTAQCTFTSRSSCQFWFFSCGTQYLYSVIFFPQSPSLVFLSFILTASQQKCSSGTCQWSMIHLKILTSQSVPPIK